MTVHHGDPAGGGRQGVAAQVHGGGSGVVGLATEMQHEAAESGDRGDHAEGQAERFQHGSLLDVELEVGEDAFGQAGFRQRGGVQTEGADGLFHR